MKKKFLLKGLLVSFTLLCSAQTWAYDFEVDNIQYTITSFDDMTVEVSGLTNKNVTEVNIPETVEYRERPLTVKTIVSKAFQSNETLETASISNTVTSIGSYAFDGCTALKEVSIGNGVTSIGKYAFQGCNSLLTVVIPDFVTSIEDYTFYGCSSLTEATISDSVTSIGDYAFYGCSSLKEIAIPNSVTSIGGHAFYNCSSLKEVTIPNSVTTIGNSAFEGCSSLKDVTIGNSVESIRNYVFYKCSSLEKATIGNSVESIGSYAFYGCSSIVEVTIPNSVTSVGSYAFRECSSLMEVTIGSSVKSIGEQAFYGCSSLKELYIPDSTTSLGDEAFVGCTSLESFSIGTGIEYSREDLKRISSSAYYYPLLWREGPIQMKNLILRDDRSSFGVRGYVYLVGGNQTYNTSFGYPSFSNIDVSYYYVGRPLIEVDSWSIRASYVSYKCSITSSQPYGVIHTLEIGGGCTDVPYFYQSIENLILGEDVATYTTKNIYQGNLQYIMCKSTIPPTLSGSFENLTYTDVTLYVPIGSKATYQATEGWKNFWDIIEMEVDDMTPVEKVVNENVTPKISVSDGSIIVSGVASSPIKVYNISGQVIYNGHDNVIPIASHGIYIVKVGSTTRKVLL